MSTIADGPDKKPRCSWALAAPEFLDYHDTEWGFPVSDDQRLFEKLCLEGFQATLEIIDVGPDAARRGGMWITRVVTRRRGGSR